MFSVVYVCMSLGGGGGSCETITYYAMHWTSPYRDPLPMHMLRLVQHGPHCTMFGLVQLRPHCKGRPPPTRTYSDLVQLGPHCTGTLFLPPGHIHTCSLWTTHGCQAGGRHPVGMLCSHVYVNFHTFTPCLGMLAYCVRCLS